MGISYYQAGQILSQESAPGLPAYPYLALLTVLPGEADTGSTITEATYTGYERIELNTEFWKLTAFNTVAQYCDEIVAPAAEAGGAMIVGWALCDADTDGNVGWFGAMVPVVIDQEDPVLSIESGALAVNLASGA